MYFDNASTTRVSDEVVDIMVRYSVTDYFNAGGLYPGGVQVKQDLNAARKSISETINAGEDQIVFTSGGSESNSLAIIGVMDYLKCMGRKCIVTSQIEHPSVIKCMEIMKSNGFDVRQISVDKNGMVDIEELRDILLDNHVGLVSIIGVNNEIGTVQDLATIGDLCTGYGALFHTDCVQGMGSIAIDVEEMCIDLLSFSGHKFHAPKGVGGLYIRDKCLISPIVLGGDQEFGLRAGTENVPSIISMAKALKNEYETGISYSKIKEAFVECINKVASENHIDVSFNGDSATNESKIVNMMFSGVDAQTLVMLLGSKGVCVSAGSACKSHINEPSHVLKAIGLSDEDALSSIRVSFSKYNSIDEVKRGAELIIESVLELTR